MRAGATPADPAHPVTNPVSSERRLRPCPLCAGEPYVYEGEAFPGDEWQVGCYCGQDEEDADEVGSVWRNGETFEQAAERWNSRPIEAELIAALDRAAKWFREYEEIHTRKRDSVRSALPQHELQAKIDRNRERAEYLEAAIAQAHAEADRG